MVEQKEEEGSLVISKLKAGQGTLIQTRGLRCVRKEQDGLGAVLIVDRLKESSATGKQSGCRVNKMGRLFPFNSG